jgi:hypothetical protein
MVVAHATALGVVRAHCQRILIAGDSLVDVRPAVPAMRFFQALPTFIVATAHATAPGPASAQPPTRLHTPGQRMHRKPPAWSGVWSSFPPSPARSCTASRDAGEASWPGAGYRRHEALRLTDAAPDMT